LDAILKDNAAISCVAVQQKKRFISSNFDLRYYCKQ